MGTSKPGQRLGKSQQTTVVEESDPWDSYSFGVSEIVVSQATKHQMVTIAVSRNYGRMLLLDGAIQSAESDERLYHEMLVHPAMGWHPNPRDVLIIGGGEGATLREVLKYDVASATMVDLDAELVALCRAHLPTWHAGAFDDQRTRLVFADGREVIERERRLYDVIIIDVVDMLEEGPAARLYTQEFYARLRERLRPNGMVVVQALEFSHNRLTEHASLARTLRTAFSHVRSYVTSVPSFLSAWGFLLATDSGDPLALPVGALDAALQRRVGFERLEHVDESFIRASFALDRHARRLLAESGTIIRDSSITPSDHAGGAR